MDNTSFQARQALHDRIILGLQEIERLERLSSIARFVGSTQIAKRYDALADLVRKDVRVAEKRLRRGLMEQRLELLRPWQLRLLNPDC